MELTQYNELWKKIESFQLDDPAAARPFSAKLAAEQGWTPAYTSRVIKEYLKFIFLCCISPRGASPSHDVDMVWHLHLTYTKNYWTDFCANTLGKEVHHAPSSGGTQENHKHVQWYAETLDLYEKVFGYSPASDIWTRNNQKNAPLAEAKMPLTVFEYVGFAAMFAIPFIVNKIYFDVLNPFTLTGPEFLVFYSILVISGLVVYYISRQRVRKELEKIVEENYPTRADIFQTTKYHFGDQRAFQTGVVDLVRRNLLEINKEERFLLHKEKYIAATVESNPMVRHFLAETDTRELTLLNLSKWYHPREFESKHFGRLFEFSKNRRLFSLENLPIIVPVVIGACRSLQGVLNDQPSVYIILLTIVAVASGALTYRMLSRKSIVTKKAKELSEEVLDLENLHTDKVVADFGLRGNPAISLFSDGVTLAGLFIIAREYRNWDTSTSGSACTSCSGDNSGGDSGGDGGGSDGGSGCGGCGGGGD